MDSLTQIALGAGVADAVLGRRVGNRAALVGAVCGTLPDLDSFIPYADAVATMTFHRSWSHSVFVLTLLSPLIAWLAVKLQRTQTATYRQWWLLVFLVLVTHPMLDCFTVYGTQIFWPLIDHAYSGSTVFIIDPAYTTPLALGVLIALFLQRDSRARRIFNSTGLILSSLYLLWTVAAKFYIEERITGQLRQQGISYTALLSTPAPFNTILWRLVVMTEGGYFEAYYSVLDAPHTVAFKFVADEKELLAEIASHWPVQRLQWFTQGFNAVHRRGDALVMEDLRMGVEPAYTFSFRVAEFTQTGLQTVTSTQMPVPVRMEMLQELLHRTFNPVQRDHQ